MWTLLNEVVSICQQVSAEYKLNPAVFVCKRSSGWITVFILHNQQWIVWTGHVWISLCSIHHGTVLIIFPLILETVTIAQMFSAGGEALLSQTDLALNVYWSSCERSHLTSYMSLLYLVRKLVASWLTVNHMVVLQVHWCLWCVVGSLANIVLQIYSRVCCERIWNNLQHMAKLWARGWSSYAPVQWHTMLLKSENVRTCPRSDMVGSSCWNPIVL